MDNNTVRLQDSAMVAAIALGVLIDQEFVKLCREAKLDPRIAITAPLDHFAALRWVTGSKH